MFAAHVNDMVGVDRGWTNLLFVMHLGRRLYKTSSSVGVDLRDYFGRFLAGAFGEQIARSGSTVSFCILWCFVNHSYMLYFMEYIQEMDQFVKCLT